MLFPRWHGKDSVMNYVGEHVICVCIHGPIFIRLLTWVGTPTLSTRIRKLHCARYNDSKQFASFHPP